MRPRLFSSLLLVPLFSCLSGTAAPAAAAPNVIVLVADDLGYGDVSCNGHGKIKTPAIDRLAAEGGRFTSAYAPSSTCTPTRYAMLTGEYAWRKAGTGILPGDAGLIISPSRLTLPRIFQNAGYATAAVGKWHLGLGDGAVDFNQAISPGPRELGFGYSFHMAATGDRVPCVFIENGRVVNLDPADPIVVDYRRKVGERPTLKERPDLGRMKSNEGHADTIINGIGRIGFMGGGEKALWDDQTLSDVFNEKALGFIRENKERPFFIYYAAHEPHVPRDPNPRFVGKSGLGARADAVLHLDDQVERLMAALSEAGVAENTLFILTSDNGPAVADGYADGALRAETAGGHTPNGPFRGGKYGDYEGGTRMPFIARWPGRIKPGTVSDVPLSLVDLPALAAALTGTELGPQDAPDSHDILAALTGDGPGPHEFLLFGNPGKNGPAAIRKGDWKLIFRQTSSGKRNPPNQTTPDPKGAPQLFNLADDPSESRNLAAQHPEIVRELRALAEKAQADGFTRPGAERVEKR